MPKGWERVTGRRPLAIALGGGSDVVGARRWRARTRPLWLSPSIDLVLGGLLLLILAGLRPTDVPVHAIFAVLVVRAFAVNLWGTVGRLAAIVVVLAGCFAIGAVGTDVDAVDLSEWLLLIALVPLIAILAERRERSTRMFAGLYSDAADKLVTSQDELRRQVAQDLHDGVGQGLGALMLTLDLLGARVSGEAATLALVERARRLAEIVLGEVEGVALLLHPAIVHENGLTGAIGELAAHAGTPVELTIDPELDFDRLTPAAQTTLFRVVQEALSNVARHSGASLARIVIESADGTLLATIADDGVGFVPARARGRGLGLLGMEERAVRVGGRLDIASRRDLGTVVSLVLPWPAHGPSRDPSSTSQGITSSEVVRGVGTSLRTPGPVAAPGLRS